MTLNEFKIGSEFWCSNRRWRCTDIGTRVVIALRVDQIDITSLKDGVQTTRTISGEEAEKVGWFSGPPYRSGEHIFDEYDLEVCTLTPDEDDDT